MKDWRVFSAHRKIILLAKFCLDILSDLDDDNSERKDKLSKVLEEFPDSKDVIKKVVHLYDPVNEEFLNRSRKRILDKANDLSREFESELKG